MSKVRPSLRRRSPPAVASWTPLTDRGQSAQPVKRFCSFHVDSPCLTRTRVYFMQRDERLLVAWFLVSMVLFNKAKGTVWYLV